MDNAKVGIIIVAYQEFECLKACLDSIRDSQTKATWTVHLLDNGSSKAYASHIHEVFQSWQATVSEGAGKWYRSETNLGFAGGNNLILRELIKDRSYTHFLLLNTDTVVTPGFLDELLSKQVDVIGPVTNAIENEQKIDAPGMLVPLPETLNVFARERFEMYQGLLMETNQLAFFCTLFTRKLMESVGLLDEQFFPGGYEDDDYCLRIKRAGYRLFIARDVFIYHKGSASFEKLLLKDRQTLAKHNRTMFEKKWNVKVDERSGMPIQSLRQDIMYLLNKQRVDDTLKHRTTVLLNEMEDIAKKQSDLARYYQGRDEEITALYKSWDAFLACGQKDGQLTDFSQLEQFLRLKMQDLMANVSEHMQIQARELTAMLQDALTQQRGEQAAIMTALQDELKRQLQTRSVEFEKALKQQQMNIQEMARMNEKDAEQQRRIAEKENEIAALETQITNMKQLMTDWDVGKMRETMESLSKTKAYKIGRSLRSASAAFHAGSKEARQFTRACFSRLCGNHSAFDPYVDQDVLTALIREASEMEQKMNRLATYISTGVSIVDKPLSFPSAENRTMPPKAKRRRVAYMTNMLLDWSDGRPRFGGGERYAVCLADLLTKQGFEVHFYQVAFSIFHGEYYGYPVQTLLPGDGYSEFNLGATEEFYKISLNYDYVIYNLPEYGAATMRSDALLMCHGIWFDHDNYRDNPSIHFRTNEWFYRLHRAFDSPRHIVSVDTNSINVIRSLWPEIAPKMTFIPNFADTKLFSPPEKRDNEKLVIIFPRRAQVNRGSRLLGDILKQVKEQNVEIYWIGEGDPVDNEIIHKLVAEDKRLHFVTADFAEMAEWYRKADISVVPTIACEGTSLSCIESMACGCATIATNVGGLPDVIFDEINGLVVNPTADDLAEAINRLIEDEALRKRLQKAGEQQAHNLSISNWERKWMKVLRKLGWITSEKKKRYCIVTKNAVHGGVESLIKLEQDYMDADVIVAGGLNNAMNTCPFTYRYVTSYAYLTELLKQYAGVIYHWLPNWAVQAIHDAGVPSVEFVHRTDTAECDKTIPTRVASHSQYVCDYIKKHDKRECIVVNNAVDTEFYVPTTQEKPHIIGAVTSYTNIKGVDILIRGWALAQKHLPGYEMHLYGAGVEKENFMALADELGVKHLVFHGPVANSKAAYDTMELVVSGARQEGLPIALLEALSCNVPILVSNIPGHTVINQLAEKAHLKAPLELFVSEDEADFAKRLVEVVAKHGNDYHGREVAEKVFSPKVHVNGLLRLLESAAKDELHPATIVSSNNLMKKAELNGSAHNLGQPMKLGKGDLFTITLNINPYEEGMFTVTAECLPATQKSLSASIDTVVNGKHTNVLNEGIYIDQNGRLTTFGIHFSKGTEAIVCRLWSNDGMDVTEVIYKTYMVDRV